jgi:hypothetical protein
MRLSDIQAVLRAAQSYKRLAERECNGDDWQTGELVRAIGLNRHWDRFGWPQMCRQSGEAITCD